MIELSQDRLVKRLPDFLQRLADADSIDPQVIIEALTAADLSEAAEHRSVGKDQRVRLTVADGEDLDRLEKRLRTAVSRKLGKPSGSDKHWDAGAWQATVRLRETVDVTLRAQLSMSALRRLAADWLNGAELAEWLVAHEFVDADATPDEEGTWPRGKADLTRAFVRTGENGTTVSFSLEPGVRPPGSRAGDDDGRFAESLAFLAGELGQTWPEGWWHNGSRSFTIRRQRSYSRSVELVEAPPGKVHGPALTGLVTIDTTPEPEPAGSVAAISTLAEVRGLLLAEARERLVEAGLVTDAEPEELPAARAFTDPAGRDVELTLVDGRVARSAVQIAADSEDVRDRISAVLTPELGEPLDHVTWPVGDLQARVSRRGEAGFERWRAEVGDRTGDALNVARAWLLEAQGPGEIPLTDSWHGRCAGAVISAEVVPAATPGVPVWRVDDRLMWLEGGRLLGAHRPDWPAWGSTVVDGSTASPVPADQVADFAAQVASWEAPVPEDFRDAVVALGWATNDSDAVTISRAGDLTLRLRRPAGGALTALVRENGTVKIWRLALACHSDAEAATQAGEAAETALAPYRDPERQQGWQLGSHRVKPRVGHPKAPSFWLEATVALPA